MADPSTSAVQVDDDQAPRAPVTPVTPPGRGRLWLGILLLLGTVVVAAHLVGLRVIWASSEERSAFRGEQLEWQARLAERTKLKTEWDRLEAELNDQLSKVQAKLSGLRAESVSAQSERDRVVGDLTQRRAELDLVRKGGDEAVTQQQQSQREKDRIDLARKDAEAAVATLRDEEKRLRTGLEQLRGDQDRLQKSLEATGLSLQRSLADLATAKERSDAADKERRTLVDDAKRADQDLQAARKSVAEAQALVAAANSSQVRLSDEAKALKDSIDGLSRERTQLLSNVDAARKDQDHLDKDLADRRAEARSLQEQIRQLQDQRKREAVMPPPQTQPSNG